LEVYVKILELTNSAFYPRFQYVTPDASKNVITPLRDPVITTPFRTPKSVKGKNMDKSDQRILGTKT